MRPDLEPEHDDAVEDPRPDPADVGGGVDGGSHKADAEHRAGRRRVRPDLLIEGNQGGADQRGRGAADQRHTHEEHHDGQEQPFHGATVSEGTPGRAS